MADIGNRYTPDPDRGILWIGIPRCGSSSIHVATGQLPQVTKDEALEYADLFTVTFIRDWRNRIVSAIEHSLKNGWTFQENMAHYVETKDPNQMNVHVRPMSDLLDGFRLDFVGRIERIADDWHRLRNLVPDLSTLGRHAARENPSEWWEVGYDWSRVQHKYIADKKLCEAHP